MPKLELNRKGVRANLTGGWGRANKRLEENFNYEVSSPKWGWPRQTVRSRNRVAGSPRDIVDSGDLLDSYKQRKAGLNTVTHTWDVPYSAAVHQGARLKSGVQLPARPFTHEPLKYLPELFAEEVNK